jgi:HEPN domain-containing protein
VPGGGARFEAEVTGDELARSYLEKARLRLRVLDLLVEEGGWSDVVREAQELVELALKAALRLIGVDPPRWHDVGPVLVEHAEAYPEWFRARLGELAEVSRWLRREREFAFYGEVDLIPTQAYGPDAAERARRDARLVYECVARLLEERGRGRG